MSRLSELIAELCPDGVEYKSLNEIVVMRRGRGLSKKDKADDGVAVILYGELYTTYGNYIHEVTSRSAESVARKSLCVNRGDLLLPITSTTAEALIGKASVLATDDEVFLGGDAVALTPTSESLSAYLMYVINSAGFERWKMLCVSGTTIRHLNPKGLLKVTVPVPPIEVQREVVRILDSFQELDDALTAEIEAREKQLATLCDSFVCNEAFEQKTLGEVCQLRKGRGLQKKDFSEFGVGCIHYGQIYTRFGLDTKETLTYVPEDKANGFTWVEPNDIVVAITSENVEDVCKSVVWTGKEEIVTGAHAAVLHPKINPLYLAYCLRSHDFERQKIMIVDGVKVIEMKVERLSLVKLRVPSRLIQDEIVDKLESVRGLINEMKIEREARRKQFAYYRDKLLDLPEKVTT